MSQKNVYALFIMIWLTVLTIWAVNKIVVPLNNNLVTVQGIPGHPTPQQISTVQIDKDTVWVIEANSDLIKVITHDTDGYHMTQIRMSIQNQYEVPNISKVMPFQINSEDISNVTVYTGTKDQDISGVIDTAEDIQALTNLLNNSPVLDGDATADYYRLLKISMKDGSVISLEFGGNGGHFKNLDTGVFYYLEPLDNEKALNKIIDRIEKEYKG